MSAEVMVLLGLGLVVVSLFVLPPIFELIYKMRYGLRKEQLAKFEVETRSTIGQVAVGLAGFFVLFTAVKSLDLSNKNFELARSIQLAERFSEAVNLLHQESDSSVIDSAVDAGYVARVGVIFALNQIAVSESTYLEPTLHVLAAIVQNKSPRNRHEESSGAREAADLSGGDLATEGQEPSVGVGSREDNFRFRPCAWWDAHQGGMSPYAPPLDHEVLAPDIAAALTVIGQLGKKASHRSIEDSAPAPGSIASDRQSEVTGADVFMAREIDLSKANLCFAYVKGGDLRFAWLRHSDLRGAILDDADLRYAGLVAVDLRGAHLPSADLANADLSCAILSDADLGGAKLGDANLSGADLQTAKNLTQDQVNQACGSSETKLPNGLQIVDCSKKEDSRWKNTKQPACPIERGISGDSQTHSRVSPDPDGASRAALENFPARPASLD